MNRITVLKRSFEKNFTSCHEVSQNLNRAGKSYFHGLLARFKLKFGHIDSEKAKGFKLFPSLSQYRPSNRKSRKLHRRNKKRKSPT